MSELYHAKFKKKKSNNGESDHPNPFSDGSSVVTGVGSVVSKIGNKAKNTIDRVEGSTGYQKVQTSQKFKNTSGSKSSLGSKVGSTFYTTSGNVSSKAKNLATAAKAIKEYKDSKSTVDDEYDSESKYNLLDNPPKKLRKKLNKTKLKEIVGPKGRR